MLPKRFDGQGRLIPRAPLASIAAAVAVAVLRVVVHAGWILPAIGFAFVILLVEIFRALFQPCPPRLRRRRRNRRWVAIDRTAAR